MAAGAEGTFLSVRKNIRRNDRRTGIEEEGVMATTNIAKVEPIDMKLEVVIIPVSDVDRAKAFYEKLGFRLDIDIVNENFRGIQFTLPRSEASIIFGNAATSARPGSADLLL